MMNFWRAFMQWWSQPRPAPIPASAPLLVMSNGAQNIVCFEGDRERAFIPSPRGHTPSWTPDGSIIFATPGGDEIKIMDATGRNARSIFGVSNHLRGINKPHLVGDTILFTCTERGNTGAVWVMRKDGTGLRMLTPTGTAAFLSPDAKWVTFTRERTGPSMHRQIWRIDIDGSNERQVTFGDDPAHPDGNASAISPDGNVIAVFWGPEDDGTNSSPDKWGQRDLAEVPALGGAAKVIVAATPATQPGFPGNYPPLPALLSADNPAPYRDASGLAWWIFDGGRPDGEGGTFKVRVGGGPITRISREMRGAGNVPMR